MNELVRVLAGEELEKTEGAAGLAWQTLETRNPFHPEICVTDDLPRALLSYWSIICSFLFHALAVCFFACWTLSGPLEPVPRVVSVQIVEERKKRVPVSPAAPKPKKIQKTSPPKTQTPLVAPPKEEPRPSPSILVAAERKRPQTLPLAEEKMGVEEKPKEDWMEQVEPGRWGIPQSPQDAEPLRPAKEEPAMSLTIDPGSAAKGIPGGLARVTPWGKGTGSEAGVPGGVEGGKGTVPPKGARTGSVYFQGDGIGRGDLGSYLGNARMRIEKAKRYPREARRRGWEGKVVLSFQINQRGEVAQIRIVHSSGYQMLDEEGIATLRRASPFSPPPWSEEEKVELEIPLVFRLEERR